MKKYLLIIALSFGLLPVITLAVQTVNVVYVQTGNGTVDFNTTGYLMEMGFSLNNGSNPGMYYKVTSSSSVGGVVGAALTNKDQCYAVLIHGSFVNGVFTGNVVDTTGEFPTAFLNELPNIRYYYCGMNGDNRAITLNNVGYNLARSFGGNYISIQVGSDGSMGIFIDRPDGSCAACVVVARKNDDDEGNQDNYDDGSYSYDNFYNDAINDSYGDTGSRASDTWCDELYQFIFI